MIDIENIIIDAVSKSLEEKFPKAVVTGGYPRHPQKFPTVHIYESDNVAYQNTIGSDHVERHATLTYTVTIFVNDATNKKGHARNILHVVDECLTKLGMHRTMNNYGFRGNESTIYSITTMYSCLAGESPSGAENEVMIYGR